MSVENGKVCCNCRHCVRRTERVSTRTTVTLCFCDIDEHYIGYVECMEYWCKHWAKDKAKEGAEEDDN